MKTILLLLSCCWLPAQDLAAARAALEKKNPAAAREILLKVREAALQDRDDPRALAAVQVLAHIARGSGDYAATEDWLSEALDYTGRLKGYSSMDVVDIRLDIANLRRLRKNFDGAMASLQEAHSKAVFPRPGDPVRAARTATLMAQVSIEMGNRPGAEGSLMLALRHWDESLREDPELLPALEMLAGFKRDQSNYEAALPLYQRALRVREVAFGPESAELIVGLDNAAYVLSGLRRYEEAEPLYKKLLQIWLDTAGRDHPMVALTMDKVAEFYAAQKRTEEGETLARQAYEARARGLAESLRLRARLAAEAGRPTDADRYRKEALAILDAAGSTSETEQPFQPAPPKAKVLRRK